MNTAAESLAVPDEALGDAASSHRRVNCFYELMDQLPEACTVRQIHPEGLRGSAESLFECPAPRAMGPV